MVVRQIFVSDVKQILMLIHLVVTGLGIKATYSFSCSGNGGKGKEHATVFDKGSTNVPSRRMLGPIPTGVFLNS